MSLILTNIKNNVAYSCGYKLEGFNDKLSKSFKSYLVGDAVYSFISRWKNILTKNLWWLKKSQDFDNSTKCWICNNVYFDGDVKVRDHCHITGKYRGSAHRDCNSNVKLNHKISVVFQT